MYLRGIPKERKSAPAPKTHPKKTRKESARRKRKESPIGYRGQKKKGVSNGIEVAENSGNLLHARRNPSRDDPKCRNSRMRGREGAGSK